MIHILIKSTILNLNIIGCYLDVESRQDNNTIERVWTKLVSKIEVAIGRGEGVVLMGDLNRPLQAPKPSYGTKLLTEWEAKGTVHILNDKTISTRIDPHTGKGSTLDLGVVSLNIKNLIMNFEVDTGRNWSPFSLKHVRGGQIVKKFSDHLGIKMEIKITKAEEPKQAKREIIDYKNEEGWKNYKEHSEEIADEIKKIALNGDLTIDEVREQIRATDEMVQRKCFGTKWVGPKKQKRAKKRPLKETKELFQEQCDELDELIATGTQYKDINRRLWRLKELMRPQSGVH